MNRILFRVAVILIILLSGCIKSNLGDCLVEPGPGTVTVTTDWSERGEGVLIPSEYTVIMGDYSAVVSGPTNPLENTFDPGTYSLLIYNSADDITVTGSQASVATIDPPEGAEGTFISPMPGWFFSSATEVEIDENKGNKFTSVMNQNVGGLTLILEPTGESADDISSITGWLSGVASTIDMTSGQVSDAANIPVVFTLDPADGKWKAAVQILGITGAEQILTTSVTFSNGIPAQQTESDMSEALESFNENKTDYPPLEAEIVTPTGGEFTVTINGWRQGNGSGGTGTAT